MIKIEELNLMASGDACLHLGIKSSRLKTLVKQYNIPKENTSAGMIFLKEDLDHMQEMRKDKLKHRRKKQ